jgi:hypothetical protein
MCFDLLNALFTTANPLFRLNIELMYQLRLTFFSKSFVIRSAASGDKELGKDNL